MMQAIKAAILACLKDFKGSGKFVSAHIADFVFPGLVVEGLGEIAFPVNEAAANTLISVAKRAPFGKGRKTIIDSTVRNTWEIDADSLSFSNPRWSVFLDEVIRNIKPDLGLEDYEISAHLYKLLIYETGSFFLPHRDSEKEKGMFGTLVIELPAHHTGGELVVSFEGKQDMVSFAQDAGNYGLGYAAFYADCEHEIKPVTAGNRVSLVYNLIQQSAGKKIAPASLETGAVALAGILKQHQQRTDAEPAIILLGHQYTPENFSLNALKLNDRPKAAVLMQAAQKEGYYAKLCLVTSYLLGSPEGGGGYYDDDDDDDAEMDEVLDESLSIEHWAEGGVPKLSQVSFSEEDLITSFPVNDGDPVVKESTGYMGNYGPDLMHWYHYGAVMIWSAETNGRLLLQQDTESKLDWIGHLAQDGSRVSTNERAAINVILSNGFTENRTGRSGDYNAIANWVLAQADPDLFLRIDPELARSYFTRIDTAHWLKLIPFLGAERSAKVLGIAGTGNMAALEKLLAILCVLPDSGPLSALHHGQVALLSRYLSELLTTPRQTLTVVGLSDLLQIAAQYPQSAEWTGNISAALTRHVPRDYVHNVLAPQLLRLTGGTPLAADLLDWCRNYLQSRVADQPKPPTDWSRELPDVKSHSKEWALLKAFLQSPHQHVFDYKKVQMERNEMESAIRHAVVDLKMETIKSGSPHTLRITKTQASYQRQLKGWNEDMALLERVAARYKLGL